MFVSTRCNFPNFSITWLSGLNEAKNSPTTLFPKLTPEIIKELGLEKGVEGSMSAFLLESDNKKALFDTGLNEKLSTGIPDRLKELKINPNEIDYIFITHFHADHIGGLINSKDEISYKNAKIYVSKEEYDGWINKMPKDKNELQVKIMKICEKNVIQFKYPDICATYDHDEKGSIESRKNILKYAKDNKLLLGGMHLKYSNSSIYQAFYKK